MTDQQDHELAALYARLHAKYWPESATNHELCMERAREFLDGAEKIGIVLEPSTAGAENRQLRAELRAAVDAARALLPRIKEAFSVGVNETTYCLVWPEVDALYAVIDAYDAAHPEGK